ncbi:RNA polymerase-binding protein DksA [Candidatus Spongiihabitans sp.]|uniref:RNA polymerase-binding protein DksA n=1 Tax=Candidatus Spongiihabitans sp. TaxID=3101308 RepID=UPI003C7D4A45
MTTKNMTTKKGHELLIHGIKPYRLKKSEKYMADAQLAHFEAILKAWREQLADETSRTVNNIQDETANHPDPTDRASQETDMALELRGRDRDRKLIKKIEISISQLSSGDFGYCENCGEEIGFKRLEARPTASLCIDCKTLDEIREKQLS